jgi:hypothetical protein
VLPPPHRHQAAAATATVHQAAAAPATTTLSWRHSASAAATLPPTPLRRCCQAAALHWKKMMAWLVVGCGGQHNVSIVSIFGIYLKSHGLNFCVVMLVNGLHKNAFHHAS